MQARSARLVILLALCATVAVAGPAAAAPLTASSPVEASAGNPFAGCPADGAGINFPDSEVEPWVDVNPLVPGNVVGSYQQDRYSNGGAKGLVVSSSFDGGATWTQTAVPNLSRCSSPGGGPFERATDPWHSFGPDGALHFMSLVLDPDPPTGGFGDNAMVYNRSTDGGTSWEPPIVLRQDTDPRFLNDKNSITADPNDPDFVYAVWDRLQIARGETVAAPQGRENIFGLGFRGPVWFARTTNGGDSFEPARIIFDPKGANNQTLGSQVAVRPQGTVINFFNEIVNFANREGGAQFEFNLSLIRSHNKGATWERNATRVSKMRPMDRVREDGVIDTEPVPCPDPGDQGACPIRAADALFDVAVDPNDGDLYAVWQDARFSNFQHDDVALSRSTDGGGTWSAPIKVNQTPAGEPVDDRQAFTPSVHVDPDGELVVTYYDFRNNTPSDGILGTDHWAVHCDTGADDCSQAASWHAETRVTDATFDMRRAPFARGYFLGDYQGLSAADGDPLAFFSQSHAGDPASAFSSRLTP